MTVTLVGLSLKNGGELIAPCNSRNKAWLGEARCKRAPIKRRTNGFLKQMPALDAR